MTVDTRKEGDETGLEAGMCVVKWSALGLVSLMARQH